MMLKGLQASARAFFVRGRRPDVRVAVGGIFVLLLLGCSSREAMAHAQASSRVPQRLAAPEIWGEGTLQGLSRAYLWHEEEKGGLRFAASRRVHYTVAPGDTLFGIAKRYGVSVASIRRRNHLKGNNIYIGQKLVIYSRTAAGTQIRTTHTVRKGETGGKIAQRFDVSIKDLRRWNPGTNLDQLSIGQKIILYVGRGDGGKASTAQGPTAIGEPWDGALIGGVQLKSTAGIKVRTPANAWAMPETVRALSRAYGRLQAHFGDKTTVVVGDLSHKDGGHMHPHQSHQNGLDADVAFITHECAGALCAMDTVAPADLDVERQWYVFGAWLQADIAQYIFVRYSFQKPLYNYARARGASDAQLDAWFQYPRPKSSHHGIIRNWEGHASHYHVRFKDPG